MHPDVQAYKDKWAEKTQAKRESLEATGEALLASLQGRPTEPFDAIVKARGHAEGDEGRLEAEAIKIAQDYVDAHPEQFTSFEQYVNTDKGNEVIVSLIATLGKAGHEEEALKLTMFELVRFERQGKNSGIQIRTRGVSLGGGS